MHHQSVRHRHLTFTVQQVAPNTYEETNAMSPAPPISFSIQHECWAESEECVHGQVYSGGDSEARGWWERGECQFPNPM